LGTPKSPQSAHVGSPFRGFHGSRICYRLPDCSPSCADPTGLPAVEDLPSRPGEFHPEPLTDSGRDTLASSGSCHRLKAAAFRRDMELVLVPVGSIPTAVNCPL